jgi:hypothetical protein
MLIPTNKKTRLEWKINADVGRNGSQMEENDVR